MNLKKYIPKVVTQKYDSGYPTEPVGGGNPYYRCVYCKITDPQINGDLMNHAQGCEYKVNKLFDLQTGNI